jgi:hypothetical protein
MIVEFTLVPKEIRTMYLEQSAAVRKRQSLLTIILAYVVFVGLSAEVGYFAVVYPWSTTKITGFVLLGIALIASQIYRQFRIHAHATILTILPQSVEVNSDYCRITVISGEAVFRWQRVKELIQSKSYFGLWLTTGRYIPVPIRSFDGDAQSREFSDQVRRFIAEATPAALPPNPEGMSADAWPPPPTEGVITPENHELAAQELFDIVTFRQRLNDENTVRYAFQSISSDYRSFQTRDGLKAAWPSWSILIVASCGGSLVLDTCAENHRLYMLFLSLESIIIAGIIPAAIVVTVYQLNAIFPKGKIYPRRRVTTDFNWLIVGDDQACGIGLCSEVKSVRRNKRGLFIHTLQGLGEVIPASCFANKEEADEFYKRIKSAVGKRSPNTESAKQVA